MKDYRHKDEMDNMEYEIIPLKFLPEDEEKMANMSVSEKIEYIRKLKANNRYSVVNEDSEGL